MSNPPLMESSKKMIVANWKDARLRTAVISAAVLMLPVSFYLMATYHRETISLPIALTMALGPLVAAIWLWFQHEYDDLANAVLVTVVIGLGSLLVAYIGTLSYFSYTLLKSLGLLSYGLLGVLPLVAFGITIFWLLKKRPLDWWSVVWVVLTLLGPWFWSGAVSAKDNGLF